MENTKTIEAQRRLFEHYEAVDKAYIESLELQALTGAVHPDNPEILANGMRSKLGLSPTKIAAIKEKKGKQILFEFLIFLQAIEDTVERLDTIIAELEEQMNDVLDRIERAAETAEQLDEEHDLLEGELEFFQEKGRFDLNADDAFNNKDAEDLITRLEQETGQAIDRSDSATYSILLDHLAEIDQRRQDLRGNIQADTAEYEVLKEKLDRAREIKADLESGDPETSLQALNASKVFLRKYDKGYTPKIDESLENELSVNLAPSQGKPGVENSNADDFSFGFPPLKSDFGNAHDGNVAPSPENQQPDQRPLLAMPVSTPGGG